MTHQDDNATRECRMVYEPLLLQLIHDIPANMPCENFANIPQPFIPEWGVDYFSSDVKIAFVGLETYGWGRMDDFVRQGRDGNFDTSFNISEFQNLDFKHWGATHRHTFWGFNTFFLGALYGLKNWEVLKTNKHQEILRSIAWGNATSVERWENCRGYGCQNSNAWQVAKEASARLDDIRLLIKVCRPNAIILLCGKSDGRRYMRFCSQDEKKPLFDKDGVQIYKIGFTYVFHACHPHAMMFSGGAQHYAQIVSAKMREYNVFNEHPAIIRANENPEEYVEEFVRQLGYSVSVRPNTYEVVLKIAKIIWKQESRMTVSMLTKILNRVGCRTTYNQEYQGGRGTFRMLSKLYNYHLHDTSEQVAVAEAFVNDSGWHLWDKS